MATVQRTILVSGASSGIGLAITKALLRAEHKVIGLARDFKKAEISSSQFIGVEIDLTKLEDVPKRMKDILANDPEIDGFVVNAGQGVFGHLEQQSFEQIRQAMDLNLVSPMLLARSVVPHLKTKDFGHIIFMGSEAALRGAQQGSLYCAAKFGLRGFAQSLREECASKNVAVTIINPGMVRTPFFDKLHFMPGAAPENAIDVEQIARLVVFTLETPPTAVLEEINLSPAKRVVQFR